MSRYTLAKYCLLYVKLNQTATTRTKEIGGISVVTLVVINSALNTSFYLNVLGKTFGVHFYLTTFSLGLASFAPTLTSFATTLASNF